MERYTFGFVYLLDGISFVPVMVGLFAITELISMVLQGGTIAQAGRLEGSLWDGFWATFRYPFTLIQSTAVGAFLGMIPGIGATAANFLAYSVAQRSSKHPEQFGKGAPEGVIAPEASNNSCIPDQSHPGAHARDSRRRDLRHPARCGNPAGTAPGADAVHLEPRADLGLLHGARWSVRSSRRFSIWS